MTETEVQAFGYRFINIIRNKMNVFITTLTFSNAIHVAGLNNYEIQRRL